jgi:hypothetical protein
VCFGQPASFGLTKEKFSVLLQFSTAFSALEDEGISSNKLGVLRRFPLDQTRAILRQPVERLVADGGMIQQPVALDVFSVLSFSTRGAAFERR